MNKTEITKVEKIIVSIKKNETGKQLIINGVDVTERIIGFTIDSKVGKITTLNVIFSIDEIR